MKKLKPIFFSILITTIFSCSKKEDEGSSTNTDGASQEVRLIEVADYKEDEKTIFEYSGEQLVALYGLEIQSLDTVFKEVITYSNDTSFWVYTLNDGADWEGGNKGYTVWENGRIIEEVDSVDIDGEGDLREYFHHKYKYVDGRLTEFDRFYTNDWKVNASIREVKKYVYNNKSELTKTFTNNYYSSTDSIKKEDMEYLSAGGYKISGYKNNQGVWEDDYSKTFSDNTYTGSVYSGSVFTPDEIRKLFFNAEGRVLKIEKNSGNIQYKYESLKGNEKDMWYAPQNLVFEAPIELL